MTLLQLLKQKHIDIRKSDKPNEIFICCPFCVSNHESPDTKFRLGVNIATDKGHCFNCEFKSRHVSFWIRKALNLPPAEFTADDLEEKPKLVKVRLPADFMPLFDTTIDDELFQMALKYIQDRGVTDFQMNRYNIGVSFTGRFAYRILFPVKYKKELKNIVARDFTGQQKARYLNSVGQRFAYNIRPEDGSRPIVLSEGIFKSLAIERAVRSVASGALLGHNITPEQIGQLQECQWKEVILWPDPDRVGIKGTKEIAEKLQESGFNIRVAWPPAKKQADELDLAEVKQRIENSVVFNWSLSQKMQLAV